MFVATSSIVFIHAHHASKQSFYSTTRQYSVIQAFTHKNEAIVFIEKIQHYNTMISTEQKHCYKHTRSIDTIFDAEWETLSHISRASRLSEKVILSDEFEESEEQLGKTTISDSILSDITERDKSVSLSSEWATSLGSDRLDLILTPSSLSEGSCHSLNDEYNIGDDGILSNTPFQEEAVDDRDSINNIGANEHDDAVLSHRPSIKDAERDHMKKRRNGVEEYSGGGSISYAQLFFDPETKALVTLMEISNNILPTNRGRTSSRRKKMQSSRLERHQEHIHKGTPLHRSTELPSKSKTNVSFSNSAVTAVKRNINDSIEGLGNEDDDDDDSPFQDETLSTECSSLSSATFRRNDQGQRGNECQRGNEYGDDWIFPERHQCSPSIRFSEEPIVFSNDGSMEKKLCWLEEADIGLYLLEDCDDPWDTCGSNHGGNARCGDSLKKLLNASKFCISLTQLGESKWRTASSYHRTSDFCNGDHHKAKLERMSYSILNDF